MIDVADSSLYLEGRALSFVPEIGAQESQRGGVPRGTLFEQLNLLEEGDQSISLRPNVKHRHFSIIISRDIALGPCCRAWDQVHQQ